MPPALLAPPDTLGRSTDLAAVVLSLGPTLRGVLGEPCRLEVDAAPGLWVLGHEEQLEAVVMDLVLDARDLGAGGGALRLSVGRTPDGSEVTLTVTDGGRGSAPGPRTGPGLALTRAIVDALGGRLRCETAPGARVWFEVHFPSRAPGRVVAAHPPRSAAHPGRATRVLVVEDQELLRQVVARVLTLRGYLVTAVGTVAEALERARGLGPDLDLVLLERLLPDGDGPHLRAALGPICPRARTVFVSSCPDGLEAIVGASVLAKPFDGRQLLEAIGAALARQS